MSDFKPSQVRLGPVPLVATMGKAEVELAAAYVVRACVVLGDKWQAVPLDELIRITTEDFHERREPMRTWGSNPFVKPLPGLMVERGFATKADSKVEFTPQGLAALKRYVRAEVANG